MNPELPSSGWFARSPTTPIALHDRRLPSLLQQLQDLGFAAAKTLGDLGEELG
jgi:hypothetical protein